MEKRYMFVFEPKYSSIQYAVSFLENGEVVVDEIKKYTDSLVKPKSKSNIRVQKNTLGEIDKVLSSFSDLRDFFDACVDPNIFKYSASNLHKAFIGYKYNQKIYTVNYIVNNPELNSKLVHLCDNKIDDYAGKTKIVTMLGDESRGFVDFINKEKSWGRTDLSNSMVDMINRYRFCKEMFTVNRNESGLMYEAASIREALMRKLTEYRNYREMFLLKQRYLESLEIEKKRLEEMKTAASNRQFAPIGEPYPKGIQLSLFPEDNKTLIKKK